ncbi:hypothetical protein F5X68DRAFT_260749 [Plectosphaerella plurivora]|uniref:Uncharacterized protein n=1 Tax=Plectosphaerella plurivora TaxID=936078 RepID=A0A9P9AD76_9PEZI|nr:hypothetical protein F5X68DRAFT_260749 [Plectosphaerella plurivora]
MASLFARFITFLGVVASVMALPHFSVQQQYLEVTRMRASAEIRPLALLETQCMNRNVHIVFHDEAVAELAICDGGIAGSVQKCRGSPTETKGVAGTARFSVKTMRKGATIEISKERWERCVRAARAVCPTGTYRAVCAGGASKGDIEFFLTQPF